VLARAAVRNVTELRQFLVGFVTPAVPVAVITAAQLFVPGAAALVLKVAPSSGLDSRLADGRLIRATGLIGHWTGLGFYCCAILAAVGTLYLLRPDGQPGPRMTTWAGAAALVGILATVTFSVLGAAVVVALATAIALKLRTRVLFLLLLTGSIAYPIFGSAFRARLEQQSAYSESTLPQWVPNTLAFRYRIWTEETIPAIQLRPSTGWGSGIYGTADPGRVIPRELVWRSAESQWLHTAISFGVAAAVLLALVTLTQCSSLYRLRTAPGASASRPVLALFVAAFAASMTVPVFTNRGLPVAAWALFGAITAVYSRAAQEEDQGIRR
jgi:hypothetical protein